MIKRSFIVLLFVLCSSAGWTQSEFQQGIAASNKKDYNSASVWFEKVIAKEPRNISALVNLGNSYFENKYFGKAILNYEKALKISPNDAEIVGNIEACYSALSMQQVYISPYGKFDLLLYRIGELTWGMLSILFSILAAFFLFQFIRKKDTKRTSKGISCLGSALLMILFIVFTREVHHFKKEENNAIVTVQNATVCQNEMGELSNSILQEGTRIKVLDQRKNFYLFKDKSGKVLYLSIADAERF
jgi:tetratricopeptide (TPR) repeat protein